MSIKIDVHTRNDFTLMNHAGDRIRLDRDELEELIVETQDALSRTDGPEPLKLYSRSGMLSFTVNENGVEALVSMGNETKIIDVENAEAIADWLRAFTELA